jgi:hypothetical protein
MYTPYAGAAGTLLHKNVKVHKEETEIISFVVAFHFPNHILLKGR